VDDLSDGSRRLLEQLREAEAPADAALTGGLERLRGALGDAVDAPGSGASPGSSARPSGSGGGSGGPTAGGGFALKLALAAVVSGVTVAALVLAGRDAPETAPAGNTIETPVETPIATPVETPIATPVETPAAEPPTPATPATPPRDDAPAPEPAAPAAPEAVKPAKGKAGADEGSNLEEELRLVRSATEASSQGEHAAALKLLAEHKRRFPRGALAGERELTRAKTLCASGERARARGVAERYLARHAKSHLAARFEEVCRD
jgi:hypothetical protein